MGCQYTCDGCGKVRPADLIDGRYRKPGSWYQRSDKDGVQDACSTECAREVNRRTGKGAPIVPLKVS
jgi:hypothetical protein